MAFGVKKDHACTFEYIVQKTLLNDGNILINLLVIIQVIGKRPHKHNVQYLKKVNLVSKIGIKIHNISMLLNPIYI